MRSEEEMYKQILDIAENDSRIMAVYMNGSRTNKNVPRDVFQDYDIVYVVKETRSFIEDKNWINKFGEITYVQDMANFVVRKQLEKMLTWKVGVLTDFSVSVGKSAKYIYKWLGETEYNEYLKTYFSGNIEEAWKAIFIMCDLFEKVTTWTANKLGYDYNKKEAEAAYNYLRKVRRLPKDIKEI